MPTELPPEENFPAWLPHEIKSAIFRLFGSRVSDFWELEFSMIDRFLEADTHAAAKARLEVLCNTGARPILYLRGFRLGAYTYHAVDPEYWEDPAVPESLTYISKLDNRFQEKLAAMDFGNRIVALENPADPFRVPVIPKLRLPMDAWLPTVNWLIQSSGVIIMYAETLSRGVLDELELVHRQGTCERTIVVKEETETASYTGMLRQTTPAAPDPRAEGILNHFPWQLEMSSKRFDEEFAQARETIEQAGPRLATIADWTLPDPPGPPMEEAAGFAANARKLFAIATEMVSHGSHDDLEACLRKGLTMACLADDASLRAEGHAQLAQRAFFVQGNYNAGLEYLAEAERRFARMQVTPAVIALWLLKLKVLTKSGKFPEAREVIRAALPLVEAEQDLWPRFALLEQLYVVDIAVGDKAGAEAARNKAFQTYSRFRKLGNQPMRRPAFIVATLLLIIAKGGPDPTGEPMLANIMHDARREIVEGINDWLADRITATELLGRAEPLDEYWELYQLMHHLRAAPE